MRKSLIIFGSTMGNTENAAKLIQSKLENADIKNIKSVTGKDIENYNNIFLGS